MAEAKAVLAWELCCVGANQLAAHECREARSELQVGRDERLDGAAMEDLAFDGAAFEDLALFGIELVEAGGEQRSKRRRDLDGLAARRPSRASP